MKMDNHIEVITYNQMKHDKPQKSLDPGHWLEKGGKVLDFTSTITRDGTRTSILQRGITATG